MYLDKGKIAYQGSRIAHWNRISTVKRRNKHASEYYNAMVEQLKIPTWNQISLAMIRIIVALVLYRMLHMVLKTDFHSIHRKNVC